MVTELGGFKCLLGGGWSSAAKPCDYCNSGAANLFCRNHSAFLCLACDAKTHGGGNPASRHERVWMCEVCEQAPAAVTCKADAAALCVTCDADIHSANPLAQRHERVPVEPFFDSSDTLFRSPVFNLLPDVPDDSDDDVELLTVKPKAIDTFGPVFFPEIEDPFLDFDYSKQTESRFTLHSSRTDSVVPVQTKPPPAPINNHHSTQINFFDLDFCRSKLSSFTQNVSSPMSQDVGVVPDGYMRSEPAGVVGKTGAAEAQATQLCGIEREARVMRYREKRKNRKFEKTIRYASRKAYAESRPRVKGRFTKRPTTTENRAGSSDYVGDYQYGVVPSC